MSDRAIIILEGSEYVGKSVTAQYLNKLIPNHCFIKLSQPRANKTGRERVDSLLTTFTQTMKLCDTMDNHVILDRFTTSERVYGPLYHGFEEDVYWRFNHIESRMSYMGAYHFLLTADETEFNHRWQHKTNMFPNENHILPTEALRVQERYIKVLDDLYYAKERLHFIDTTNKTPGAVVNIILSACGLSNLIPTNKNGVVINAP